MKKLAMFLVRVMLTGAMCFGASAETIEYTQSPILDALVESGELPPVEQRLPDEPKLVYEASEEYLTYEIGKYGGTLRLVTSSVAWSSDCFIGLNEALMTMPSSNSDEILPNIVASCEVENENMEFVFTLRNGLKWSDGTEVTMEDFRFAIENFVFNQELNPSIASWMLDGGSYTGEPFTFEILSDDIFSISFNTSYGGFLVHLSVNGLKGYTELLKPAHYLKPFHKDFAVECHGSEEAYYEYIAPFARVLGYDDPREEGVWVYVFNAIDMTNWETTDPADFLAAETFAGCTVLRRNSIGHG